MKKTKKININLLVTAAILLIYSIFLLFLIVSDIVSKHILMRQTIYVKALACLLLAGALVIGSQIFREQKRTINKAVFGLLLLPLLSGIYFAAHDINNFLFAEKSESQELNFGLSNESESNKGAQGKSFNKNLFESPLLKEKEVKIDERNFLSWYDELYRNPQRYLGKPFEMTANIFHIEIDGNSTALAGRYVLSSYSEELEKHVIMIKTDKNFDEGEWVLIKGIMSTEMLHGQMIPIVVVNYIEKTQNKGTDYIYGF